MKNLNLGKTKISLLLSFAFIATSLFFVACEKDEDVVLNNNTVELEQNGNNFLVAEFAIDDVPHKWTIQNFEEKLAGKWYMDINSKNESVSDFTLDFSEYPDIIIDEASDSHLVLIINEISIYYDITYNENEMIATVIDDKKGDKKVLSKLSFYSEEINHNSIMDFYKNNDYFIFNSKPDYLPSSINRYLGSKITQGLLVLLIDCERKVLQAKINCQERGPDYIFEAGLCGGKCIKRNPND